MLEISDEQVEAFAAFNTAKFREKLERFLCRDFPEITSGLEPAQIDARIDRGLSLGLEYGMETREDFVRFSYLYFKPGQDFETGEETEWVRNILDFRAPGKEKLDLIERAAKELIAKKS